MNSKKNSSRFKFIFPVVVVAVLAAASIFVFSILNYFTFSSVESDSDCSFGKFITIESGMTAKTLGKFLKDEGLILNGDLFYIYARFPKIASKLFNRDEKIFKVQKGYYYISSNMNMLDVFAEVSTGKTKTVTVVIPEGLTISKIAEKLQEAELVSKSEIIDAATHNVIETLNECGFKFDSNISISSVEGFLFPDTYDIPVGYDAKQIIKLMIKTFREKVSEVKDISKMSEKDFYDKIILASIIEREYRVKEEAPLIASVFNNRLSIGMGLQSCATVEYIITEIKNKPHPNVITYYDLEYDSLYNTYKYNGLPPGPISCPGFTAISAAFNPADSNYLYFTLTDSNAGKHTFSRDFNSHVKATNEFKTKKMAGN